jgi:predicted Zn finger-like uncharacterized protein
MYTQCPDCQTRFRVTATALRAAYGTVRCGRCGSLFDALQQLSDAVPAAQPAWTAPSPLPEPPSDFAPAEEDRAGSTIVIETGAGEDITLEGERISVDGLPTPDEVVVDLDATDEFEVLRIPASEFPDEQEAERELEALIERLQREFDRQVPATGTEEEFDEDTAEIPILGPPAAGAAAVAAAERGAAPPESIAVEPEPPPPAAPAPAEADDWYLRSEPTPAVTTPPVPEPEPAIEPESPAVPMQERPVRIPTEELPLTRPWRPAPVEVMPEPAAPERSPWRTLAWTVGCLLLGLVLAGQVIHHYREQLVRDPRIGMQLRAAYERLGWALPPSWNLAAIELRQSGDDDRSSGRMVVRASLTNRAVFAQPQPILRLELQDRYGTVVGTRDFEPSEYLKDPSRAAQLLEPGAGTEAELLLADPGAEAVGYRLDVCLRESATLVRCAQGPG